MGTSGRCPQTSCSRHMEQVPALTVGHMLHLPVGGDHARPDVVEGHPSGRKHTRRRQLGCIAGKSLFEEEAALAMSISLDLRSTEDHDYHLQDEADRARLILCPGDARVKSVRVARVMSSRGAVLWWSGLAQPIEWARSVRPVVHQGSRSSSPGPDVWAESARSDAGRENREEKNYSAIP
jgi:hypothetical protein